MDRISQCDSGPHTERCSGGEDCWGECWDFVGMDDVDPEDLQED